MQLGKNPWILIGLIFLEILFVLVPAYISSKIEKKTFKTLLFEMGFQKNNDFLIKIIAGLSIGVIFFSFGDFILIFFRHMVIENLFGTEFIEEGQEGVINTIPFQPDLVQIIIFVILQIIIIGPCEEAFFRGFIIKKLNVKIKTAYSVIISSIFFALYHVPPMIVPLSTTITYFGYYFAIGLLLASTFISFEYSLIPCSISHSCLNVLIFLI
ncbi:MAG: type II CAAX prenyl endopeptidase Rce1 family protein [Candidatus Hodarchaeota archaeon]